MFTKVHVLVTDTVEHLYPSPRASCLRDQMKRNMVIKRDCDINVFAALKLRYKFYILSEN